MDTPLAVDNIEQVKIARLLGVILSGNLNYDEHVTFVLSICSQRLYLIKLLCSQGMPESKVHVIFVALIISRIVGNPINGGPKFLYLPLNLTLTLTLTLLTLLSLPTLLTLLLSTVFNMVQEFGTAVHRIAELFMLCLPGVAF